MFDQSKKIEAAQFDRAIMRVLDEMDTFGPDSPEYAQHLKHLKKLTDLKTKNRRKPISSDMLALVLGNLAGILIIVLYEQKNVMVSKGLGFVLKTKTPN